MDRPSFSQVAEKTSTQVLDIIHSDVCGFMEETTPGVPLLLKIKLHENNLASTLHCRLLTDIDTT